jgi:general secretion pathway protein C
MTLRQLNILNSALLFATFAVLAILFSDAVIYKRAVRVNKVSPVAVMTGSTQVPINEYAAIVENPVFPGLPESFTPTTSAKIATASAPQADIAGVLKKLLLTGTYVSGNARRESFAVFIKTDGRTQESFRIGDTVFGLGTLSTVSGDHAGVTVGTQELFFKMPATEKATKFTPTLPRATALRAGTEAKQRASGPVNYSQKISETEWVINQDAVLNAMENMSSILSDARMTPLTINGKIAGFRVTEIRPRGIFDALGLKNNDILKRVNNYDMTSPERAIQVLSALKGERNFTIDIERAGKKMNLSYRVK